MQKLRIEMNRAKMETQPLPQPDNDVFVVVNGKRLKKIGPP